jgi:hypothetical protein
MARQSGSGTKIVGFIVLALLIGVGFYAAIIAQSALKMRDAGERLEAEASSLEASLKAGRLRDAYDSVIVISDELALIDTELNKARWTLAQNIPYLSDDVTVCQEMASIGNDLSSNALLPVCRSLEAVLGGIPEHANDIDAKGLMDTVPANLPALMASLKHASDTASSCQARAQALKPSHFDSVNAMEAELREVCDSLIDAFASYENVLGVAGVTGDLLNVFRP